MKTLVKETVVYQCEYCNHTDPFPENIRQHEKLHLRKDCKHEKCYYWICDDEVKRQCSDCAIIDSISMDGLEEEIFKLLTK